VIRIVIAMALKPELPGYAQALEEVREYCREKNVTFPYTEYPFDWPELISRPPSPLPQIAHCFADTPSLPQEQLDGEETLTQYLDGLSKSSGSEKDIYDIRFLSAYKLELPLLDRNSRSDGFRKFGPDSLQKCAASLLPLDLKNEDGLAIPKDNIRLGNAIAKDSELTVTEENAEYLKSILDMYNSPQCPDIVLPKVHPKRLR
jgi:hypothetical protein